MSHEVVISYATADKPVADGVCARLEQESIRCWIAPRDIRAGTEWGGAIIQAIIDCQMMVIIVSTTSNMSKHVLNEVRSAVEHETIIIPFRIEDVTLTGSMDYFLGSQHWLDALSPPLERHIDHLCAVVKNYLSMEPINGSTVAETVTDKSGFSEADRKILHELYSCFDRPAFRDSFQHETDLEALMTALGDTIAAINTGVKARRDGIVFGLPVPGKAQLESDYLHASFDKVVVLLGECERVYRNAIRSGYFFGSGSCIAFHHAHQNEAAAVAARVDQLRNEVLEIVNDVYSHFQGRYRSFQSIRTPQHILEQAQQAAYAPRRWSWVSRLFWWRTPAKPVD